eukprot:PhF_6_TR4250/c1_g1_i1/m.5749
MGAGAGKQAAGAAAQQQPVQKDIVSIDIQESLTHPENPYRYGTTVLNEAAVVPYELVETTDHYYIVLELPGVSSIKQVRVSCIVTDTGYDVSVSATKPSALDGSEAKSALDAAKVGGIVGGAPHQCTRRLGEVGWHGVVYGVFDGQPECNYREGIFKMRLKKRTVRNEAVTFKDF